MDKVKLWNLRFGHLPYDKLKVAIPGLNVNRTKQECFCTVCRLAIQTRLPFPASEIRTQTKCQLLHVDLWGPHRHATYNGCKMFITVLMTLLEDLGFTS